MRKPKSLPLYKLFLASFKLDLQTQVPPGTEAVEPVPATFWNLQKSLVNLLGYADGNHLSGGKFCYLFDFGKIGGQF